MNKRYVTLPVAQLVSDVAVDREHVERLAASIKAQGQLAPVTIRDGQIVDGFHRVAAIAEAGLETVDCIAVDCSDEEFLDLRITSALTHEGVKSDRAVPWIIAEVEQAWPGQDASTLFQTVADPRSHDHGHGEWEWAALKAGLWGTAVSTIAGWLHAHRRLAPDVWGDKTIPSRTRQEIAKDVADHGLQREIAEKTKREGLSWPQVKVVAEAAATATDKEERQHILETPLDQQDAANLQRRAKVAKFLKTPPSRAREDKRQDEARQRLLFFAMAVPDLMKQLQAITRVEVEVLQPEQKAKLEGWLIDLEREVNRVRTLLGVAIEGEVVHG